ncbi:nucleotidyltransferase AbiEii toxin of type IV toxin-antitoxin system [Streptomyces sp. TLI_55]|uniref:nucleotidyl transferase AbiEii/AbiGii toxin family protein n=1 Tax=Streptomyces sp. TLI_55 TaxID=1938861 RepID=UPI000BC63669|nr:nucleotidyl transferase AbiEii/AbiGii toxin family protein [Streptomyces sp. TLI_55]SNX88183.1 nucleotidyltransferase AbiEii toxin of type IV toxin-antitoxin system [Streptomyces sp. TLI_55]
MPELHARLLADVITLGSPYPLVLTGGYAVRAHRLVSRPSQDLDVATENPAPMADIAAALRSGLQERGWQVQSLETAPLSARFAVRDPDTGQEVEVDILKEIFWRPVADSPYGPVLAEEDVIGTKVRALGDRGAPRDLIDVFAASRRWSTADLEEFGRRHARGRFEREDLQANLAGAEWTDDEAFAAYGLDAATIAALRTWAVQWADELASWLFEEDESHPDQD